MKKVVIESKHLIAGGSVAIGAAMILLTTFTTPTASIISTNTITTGAGAATGTLTSSGNYNLVLTTGRTNTGVITIPGTVDNGTISVVPHGTGEVVVGNSSNPGAITTGGAQDLVLDTNSGTNSGSITITDGLAGNITMEPSTTGITELRSTDAGAVGGSLKLNQQGGTQVATDVPGRIIFSGEDSADADEDYGRIDAIITDVTAANPDGVLAFLVNVAGTLTEHFRVLTATNGVQVGDGAATAVVKSSGNFDLTIQSGHASTGTITIAGTAADGNITVAPNGTGQLALTGSEMLFDEVTAPGNPAADKGVFYVADDGGTTTPYFKDSAGTASSLIASGGISNVVEDTTPQLGGHLDVNGQVIGDGTDELLKFTEAVSPVNEFTIGNGATGNAPFLSATGGDANIGMALMPKGTGNIMIGTGAATGTLQSSGNFDLTIQSGHASTGTITVAGTAADGNITVAPNGTGQLVLSGSEMLFDEVTAPGNPAADKGVLYVADNATVTTLYFKDSAGTATSLLASGGISNVVEDTTPQLGGHLDVNGQVLGDGTNELLKFTETGSAVNELTITNAATGNGPILSATGSDTNVALNVNAKGSGNIIIGTDADSTLTLTGSADGTDSLVLTAGDILVSDGDVDISGGDFNITLDTGDGAAITTAADGGVDGLTITMTTDTANMDAQVVSMTVQDDNDDTTETFSGITISATQNSNDATNDDNLYGLQIGNLGGTAAGGNEYGIYQAGTGWDYGLFLEDETRLHSAATGNSGNTLSFYQDSTSAAAGDAMGTIGFYGNDDNQGDGDGNWGGDNVEYARIQGVIVSNSNTNEEGAILISAQTTGSVMQPVARFLHNNTDGILEVGDTDSRGILQTRATNQDLLIRTGNGTTGSITIANGANGNIALAPNGTGAVTIAGLGLQMLSSRIQGAAGADVASASKITLGTDGNYFSITGTTTIDCISSVNWQAGSVVTLKFDGSLDVDSNDTGTCSGTDEPILVFSDPLSFTADDILTLVLGDDGTWREVSHSAN